MGKNIGFVSTRFAGVDGVTLEAGKWSEVLEKLGHRCFWFAGELEKDPNVSLLVPEAHFQDKQNVWINEQVFGNPGRKSSVSDLIHKLRSGLKVQLKAFIDRFHVDLLIAENVLTIPMQIPLGLAVTEIIAETQIPTIAHHHDFYWERIRFSINAVNDYISMAFPPNLATIEHVVINSAAREELAHRRGISSVIIPNVLDFENPPASEPQRTDVVRQSLGLQADDIVILQPTRIVKRKGIEYAIGLIKELQDPKYKLVISHEAGDEGFEYPDWIKEYSIKQEVDLRMVTTRIADPWANHMNSENQPTLWDIYPYADFITYPSLIEGFGNAFLEAIYFKKPILVNRYDTFVRDIEPLGFDLAVMDGYLTGKTIRTVKEILESAKRGESMVERNYEIASRHYSYSVLSKHLSTIMTNFFGEELPQHMEKVISHLAKRLVDNQ